MHHFQKEKNSTKCIGHQNDNKENARPWQTKTFIQLWFLYLIIPGTRFTRICLVPSHSTTSPGYFGNFSSLSSLKYSEDSPHNLPLYYTYTYTELFHHCQVISPLRTVPKIYHYVPKSLLTQNCFRYNYVLSEPSVWHENWVMVQTPIHTTFLSRGSGLHKLCDVLISWADRGSCAHKCIRSNF